MTGATTLRADDRGVPSAASRTPSTRSAAEECIVPSAGEGAVAEDWHR
jgi:hypothetical protein